MNQFDATQKAKSLFGPRAFTYAKWSASPPEFIIGNFGVHLSAEDSPLRGNSWEDAFSKYEGGRIDVAIRAAEENKR